MRKIFFITLFFSSTLCALLAQSVVLDSAFGINGIAITPSVSSSEIIASTIQLDGKIVAAGYLNNSSGNYHFQVARYNPNGTLDNMFGIGGIVNTTINIADMPYAMALQADGKIVVAGNARFNAAPPFIYHSVIVRYNIDGTLDNTFGTGGITTTAVDPTEDGISSIAIQSDGKILAGGYAGKQFLIMRYSTNGILDTGFGNGGIVLTTLEDQASIYSIALQNDGKILAAGTTGDISNFKFALARYNSDGSIDIGFGNNGNIKTDFDVSCYDIATSMALLPDGKVLLAGYSECGEALFAKYNSDGTINSGFGNGGKTSLNTCPPVPPNGLAMLLNGGFVTCGSKSNASYDYSLSFFNADGSSDSTNGDIVVDVSSSTDYAQCVSVQSDGKIIVGGSSRDSASSPSHFTLVRFSTGISAVKDYSHADFELKIYPNPFHEKVTFTINGSDKHQQYELKIHDLLGREVRQYHATGDFEIERGNLPNGIYTYKLTIVNKNIVSTGKIVID